MIQPKREVRLRRVHRGSFAKNEYTLFREAQKEWKAGAFKDGDCILLVSRSWKIIIFVFCSLEKGAVFDRAGRYLERDTSVLESRVYRIVGGGAFNVHMIAQYAERIGLTIKDMETIDGFLKADDDYSGMTAVSAFKQYHRDKYDKTAATA